MWHYMYEISKRKKKSRLPPEITGPEAVWRWKGKMHPMAFIFPWAFFLALEKAPKQGEGGVGEGRWIGGNGSK